MKTFDLINKKKILTIVHTISISKTVRAKKATPKIVAIKFVTLNILAATENELKLNQ